MKQLLLIALFLEAMCIVQAQSSSLKMSAALNRLSTQPAVTDSVTVSVSFQATEAASVKNKMQAGVQLVRIAVRDLPKWASRKDVLFINQHHPAKEELNTGAVDYTANAVTWAQQQHPALRADSLKVIVKERQFDVQDIDLAGRLFLTGLEEAPTTAHAGLMATIISGAGNSSPFAKGVADGSIVGSVNFQNLFPESDSFYRNHNIAVQNHSYGTVVENFYGNEAAAFDAAAYNNPHLLLVYSAGNAGNTTAGTGVYASILGAATLTGNFKQSKNSLVVGAVDSALQIMAGASKGPAFDGRIKPEVVAYGEDGTSGAAALASGTALLIADAYKKKTGRTAPSHLMKAAVINSADDVGAPGIDYASGFGNINAAASVNSIAQNHFFVDSLNTGEEKTFNLTVPANTANLKVTLAWTDAPALPGSEKILVNDMHLRLLHTATSTTTCPWVLNKFPHPDSINAPAKRGVDTLNNVEQVSISNPAAGAYQVIVQFAKGLNGRQSFSVVYQTDSVQHFAIIHPLRSTPVLAASRQRIRWETTATGPVQLVYKTTRDWLPVAVVDAAQRYAVWEVPDTVTKAQVMATLLSTGKIIYSDSFVISRQPQLSVAFNCTDSVGLVWRGAAGTTLLQRLGDRYLTGIRTTGDSTAAFAAASGDPHFAVTPLVAGWTGVRSNAINVRSGSVGCYLESFFLQEQLDSLVKFTAQLGTNAGVQRVVLEKLLSDGPQVITAVSNPLTTRFGFTDEKLIAGQNRYRLKIILTNGAVIYSDVAVVYHTTVKQPVYAFPNPVTAQRNLKVIVREAGRYRICIINLSGQTVYEAPVNNSPTVLPHHLFSAGVYFLHVWDDLGNRWVQKIVAQ